MSTIQVEANDKNPWSTTDWLRENYLVLSYILNELVDIRRQLKLILRKEVEIMADLTALTAQVKANTDVEQSAIVLINGIAAQLAAVANDPVAVAALAQQLKTSADSLSAAVVANTPAA